jgi:hypothetical protein
MYIPMKNKFLALGLVCFLICNKTFSQYNFNSIKICHTKEGELRLVDVGEYKVIMDHGELSSISSKDSLIKYEADSKTFIINNLFEGRSIKLQLTNEGPVLTLKDTIRVINSPKSVMLENSNEDAFCLYSLQGFTFALDFSNNEIRKIQYGGYNKFLVIRIEQIDDVYTWDFLIESSHHANRLTLGSGFNKPNLLAINDDKNKVGVSLYVKKREGLFTILYGERLYENDLFAIDPSYQLKYNKKGRLKKQTSKFDLSCKY